MKPLEKHYSIVLPTVSHSGFLYKTASAGRLLQDRRAREGGCPGRWRLAWRRGPRSQGWPGRWAHKGSMYTLATTLEGFLDTVSVHSWYIINGMVRVCGGHSAACFL